MVGTCWGGPIAIEYAARHPEQVTHLVLYGTYARGTAAACGSSNDEDEGAGHVRPYAAGLGTGGPRLPAFMGFAVPAGRDAGAICAPGASKCAPRPLPIPPSGCFRSLPTSMCREAARKIKCPVLIVHPERDVSVPIDEGRLLASLIPHSRFVQLDTENHMPLADEPAWEQLVAEVRSFLARAGATPFQRAATACRLARSRRASAPFWKASPKGSTTRRSPDRFASRKRRSATILPGSSTRFASSIVIRPSCLPAKRASGEPAGSSRGADAGHLSRVPVSAPRPRRDIGLNTTAFGRLRVLTGRASHALARMPREARRRGREPRGKRNTIRSAQADPLRRWLPNERRTSCMPIFAAHSWPQL